MPNDDQTWRVGRLPRRLRVAFAAGCAGRVLRIYELDYSQENHAPHVAVDLAWRFACGEAVSETAVAEALLAAADATPDVDERGDEFTAPMRASVSAICALKAIDDPRAAVQAALSALEAVVSFDNYVGSPGQGEETETRWQERALTLVESWGDEHGPHRTGSTIKPVARDMFAVVAD